MKKLLAIFMALVMIFALTACGGKKSDDKTPAQKLAADFLEKVGKYTDMADLANAIVSADYVPYSCVVVSDQDEYFYLNGFTGEIPGFKSAAQFAPMIGSIPFIGYVFELENASDAEGFVKALVDSADMGWNVCTSADELATETSGNIVFFVMAPASFDED